MSVNRKLRAVVAWGACGFAAAVATFGCTVQPPSSAASSAPRRPDYLGSGSRTQNGETAYTRDLKRRVGSPPPDAGGGRDRLSQDPRRPSDTSLPSVSEFVNELYSAEAPTR